MEAERYAVVCLTQAAADMLGVAVGDQIEVDTAEREAVEVIYVDGVLDSNGVVCMDLIPDLAVTGTLVNIVEDDITYQAGNVGCADPPVSSTAELTFSFEDVSVESAIDLAAVQDGIIRTPKQQKVCPECGETMLWVELDREPGSLAFGLICAVYHTDGYCDLTATHEMTWWCGCGYTTGGGTYIDPRPAPEPSLADRWKELNTE